MAIVQGKLVLLGASGVGKTCLVCRYVNQAFSGDHSSTLGIAFFSLTISVGPTVVKIQVWDTAGQEKFHSLVPMFYRHASAALLVFDLADRKTFEDLQSWIQEVFSWSRGQPDPLLFVVGNKADLPERQVTESEAREFALSHGANYYEASALTSFGVSEVFLSVAHAIALASQRATDYRTDSLLIYSPERGLGGAAALRDAGQLHHHDVRPTRASRCTHSKCTSGSSGRRGSLQSISNT